MASTSKHCAEPPVWLGSIFDRIVCGVDGTESSRVAVAQAARLLAPRRVLELVGVVERPSPWAEPSDDADLERQFEEARRALVAGRTQCPSARSLLLVGDPGPMLVSAARDAHATLAVAGAPAGGRLGKLVLGSVGTQLLHSAPCSVLIARSAIDETAFPHSIVVGHDGSSGAAAAAAVAKELAHRFDAVLRIVVAMGGDRVLIDRLWGEDDLEWSTLWPTEALTAVSGETDLLVVGSSGLRGMRALGSVSERIGDLARCSVLVVREPFPSSVTGRDDAVPDDEC